MSLVIAYHPIQLQHWTFWMNGNPIIFRDDMNGQQLRFFRRTIVQDFSHCKQKSGGFSRSCNSLNGSASPLLGIHPITDKLLFFIRSSLSWDSQVVCRLDIVASLKHVGHAKIMPKRKNFVVHFPRTCIQTREIRNENFRPRKWAIIPMPVN